MLFNSAEFLFVFLPLILAAYYLLEHNGKSRLAIWWLVIASLFFYAWWEWRFLPLLLASMLINYSLGRLIGALHNSKAKQMVLITGITGNVLLLGYYKYYGLFIDGINSIALTNLTSPDIILPLAISFFTFQQITYLVDTYRQGTAQREIESYVLFVTFFPHLIAGPLVHHREMLPQFNRRDAQHWDWSNIAAGLTLLTLGLGKKVLIADPLAGIASPLFHAAESGKMLTLWEGWAAALAYTSQIYFDFSGYSDMAIGVARLFGIRLPVNFASPYRASSITEFWKRWHMTLSRFLRDYLYIALGGNRRGAVRRHINLMITMLLGGLWHGANWTFVAWGFLHGAFLVINHTWRNCRLRMGWGEGGTIAKLAGWGLTFAAVVSAWVLFRAPDFATAWSILGSMWGLAGVSLPSYAMAVPGLSALGIRFTGLFPLGTFGEWQHFAMLGAALAVAWFAPNTQAIMGRCNPAFDWERSAGCEPGSRGRDAWMPNAMWARAMGLVFALALLSLSQVSEFIYFNF